MRRYSICLEHIYRKCFFVCHESLLILGYPFSLSLKLLQNTPSYLGQQFFVQSTRKFKTWRGLMVGHTMLYGGAFMILYCHGVNFSGWDFLLGVYVGCIWRVIGNYWSLHVTISWKLTVQGKLQMFSEPQNLSVDSFWLGGDYFAIGAQWNKNATFLCLLDISGLLEFWEKLWANTISIACCKSYVITIAS